MTSFVSIVHFNNMASAKAYLMFADRLNPRPFRIRRWVSLSFQPMLALVVAPCLLALACQPSSSSSPPSPAVELPTTAPQQLESLWSAAHQGLEVHELPATPSGMASRYHFDPRCTLVYDVDHHNVYDAGHRTPRKEHVVGRVELEAVAPSEAPNRWVLRNQALGFYLVRQDHRRPTHQYWPGDLPEVHIEVMDHRIKANHDRSPLWHGMGSFSGFAQFWPDLSALHEDKAPKRASPLSLPSRARAEGQNDVQVELLTWLQIEDMQAAVIEARGIVTSHAGGAPQEGSFIGRYVILPTGVLLHGAVVQNVTRQQGPSNTKEQWRIVAEARLTGACDVPTLSPFDHVHPRAEAALDAYLRLIQNREVLPPTELGRWLSQDILDAHGALRVQEILNAHIETFGIESMGDPILVQHKEAQGDLFTFELPGRSRTLAGSAEEVTILTHVTAEAHDGEVRLLSIRSTSNQNTGDSPRQWNVLDISPARLATPALHDPISLPSP